MQGIKLRQIQGLLTTLEELNLLQGLSANASQLNVLDGYTGDTLDLNSIIGLRTQFEAHEAQDISAHFIPAGSIDGLAIADATLPQSKLSFDVATQIELDAHIVDHNDLRNDHDSLQAQVDALADVVIPGQGADIADALAQAIAHVDNVEDAHDASAISYGKVESGYYFIDSDLLSTGTVVNVGLDEIRFFRELDNVRLDSDTSPFFDTSIVADGVDYDLGTVTITDPSPSNFNIANNARITNLSEHNVQQAVTRSLRNNTDIFTGRLTIDQLGTRDAIVFTNEANLQSGAGYNLDLGAGSQRFDIDNEFNVSIFGVDNLGDSHSNSHALRDYVNGFDGLVTKEGLTDDRTWTFPDRSGWIAIGDITFQDLLRVTADTTTGEITVAPGVLPNVIGENVRAWINMAEGSDFAGATVDLATQFATDSQLAGIGGDHLAFIVYLTFNDQLFFWYGAAPQATAQDAIAAIPPYLPTAYMKLALCTIQGDGLGGLDNSTLVIHEDLRPLLGQGMSNAHYDESIHFPGVLNTGTPVALPNNSRAGGQPEGYVIGSGELEVYVNDTFREVGRDYIEVSGAAPGSVVFNYDLPANSVVRFRISWGAAVSIHSPGGGGGGGTLQDSYVAGENIFTSPGVPVGIFSGAGTALDVTGTTNLNGMVQESFGFEFQDQASEPGDLASIHNKLYANTSGDLVYKHIQDGVNYNIIDGLNNATFSNSVIMINNTGGLIPAGRPVSLHPLNPGEIIPTNVSTNTKDAVAIGITGEAIPNGGSGRVITGGKVSGLGLGYTHRDVLYANPLSPGTVVEQGSLSLSPGNVALRLGIIDGNDWHVQVVFEGVS